MASSFPLLDVMRVCIDCRGQLHTPKTDIAWLTMIKKSAYVPLNSFNLIVAGRVC